MHTQTETNKHHIKIFITVGQGAPIELVFDTERATGLEIKHRAGFGIADGLYHRMDGKVLEVTDDEIVLLKNGQHFTIVPNGRVS